MAKCNHTIYEKTEARIEGLCPLCLQEKVERLKEGINYAIGGIDALLPEEAEAKKDVLAIKQTLEQSLKGGE